MLISRFISKVTARRDGGTTKRARGNSASYRTAVDALSRTELPRGRGRRDAIFADLICSRARKRPIPDRRGNPWSSSRRSSGTTRRVSGSSGSGNGLTNAMKRAAEEEARGV